MQFYFIRHAQSSNNALYDSTGSWDGRSADPELTEMGWQQARALADYLQRSPADPQAAGRDAANHGGFGLTHLYCSPMLRAVDTGSVVAAALDLPLTVWPDWHEGGGIYLNDSETDEPYGLPGATRAQLQARYPRIVLPDSITETGWWNRSMEAKEERPVRARRVIDDLLARHGGTEDRVAVISHGGFYNHIIWAAARAERPEKIWMVLNNTAITRIDFNEDWTDMVYLNRLDHLSPGMVT
ncbi:MAG TPA: histidine phosphatase family protein [Anaerolineaceae bacterium]|nr:histidine phosphatase family protein [Anaerolineaceae bacterium]HNS36373.1 histidine phosphatase family protein [Anaerolineaceae bacterium]HNZ13603.1 histidine phosphatase family protein [Anaerolineaceae bacterium]HNZ13755.1 histidine phosphatase family protein [Anaerolineaceae bacterium]